MKKIKEILIKKITKENTIRIAFKEDLVDFTVESVEIKIYFNDSDSLKYSFESKNHIQKTKQPQTIVLQVSVPTESFNAKIIASSDYDLSNLVAEAFLV
jgi:hypothetical protein